jgi:hypothetical protein
MATSTRSGAIYGIGRYGEVRYGVSNVAIIPDGSQASASTNSGLNIIGDANHTVISVSGVGLVAQLGPNAVSGEAVVLVTGTVGTASVNDNVSFKLDYKAVVDSVQGTGDVSVPTVVAKANVELSSESGVGLAGSPAVTADANTSVTGVSATAELGTPTQKTVNRIPVTGVTATGSVGTVTIVAKAVTDITGVSATGICGTVNAKAYSVYIVTGVQAASATNDVFVRNNARPTFTGVVGLTVVGTVAVTTTRFDYQAAREQYDRSRTVYVERKTGSKDRTVLVPFENRTVYVEARTSTANRVVYIPAQPRVVHVERSSSDSDRTLLAA